MRKLFYLCLIISALTLSGCIGWYYKMAHLSDDDLAWFQCCNVGDSILFYSDGISPDTVIIDYKKIKNTSFPFYIRYIDYPLAEFDAFARYTFYIKTQNDSIEGSFSIKKIANDNSIEWNAFLDRRYSDDIRRNSISDTPYHPIKIESFYINGICFDDCIVIDNSNSKLAETRVRENPIETFVFKRNYGLIYYRYPNGTEYVRKF